MTSSGVAAGSGSNSGELVLVVDVGSFDKEGYVGTSVFQGKAVEIDFDDKDHGLTLTKEMASKLRVREGSQVELLFEGEGEIERIEMKVAGVEKRAVVSSASAYYLIGQAGGGILRVTRG